MSDQKPYKYRVAYNVPAEVVVDVEIDPQVIEDWVAEGNDPEDFDPEEYAAEQADKIAREEIETWGIFGRARLHLDIDGIGGDVEEVDD